MSLLLDALKKAAEQKAKNKSEAPENRSSDETLLDVGQVDETARLGGEDLPQAISDDETQLEAEQTRLEERLARGDRIAGDDTNIDVSEDTKTAVVPPTPDQTNIEATTIDVPDTTRTVIETRDPDETLFDQSAMDVPEVTQTMLVEPETDTDETSLDASEVTATVLADSSAPEDDSDKTGVDVPEVTQTVLVDEETVTRPADDPTSTRVDVTEAATRMDLSERPPAVDDETLISDAPDVTDVAADRELDSRRPVVREDQTDLNPLNAGDADRVRAGLSDETLLDDRTSAEEMTDEDDTKRRADDDEDADMSLLLVEPDPTRTGVTTGFTDPQVPSDRARVLQQGDGGLELEDRTATRPPEEPTDTQGRTITNPTATMVQGDDTLAPPTRSTITRSDPTSTHTYAPDNYDRTLMKLPSDDASKLFAGMKPESDVVMTPDYAKKVFQSKTSARQTRHYQTYAAIGLVLFLAVGLFGVFQYQDKSEQIETSLRPLKRDPMPGVIKIEEEPQVDLFATNENQADARTMEIIATADEEVELAEPEELANLDEQLQGDVSVEETEVAQVEASESPEVIESAESVEPEPAPEPVPAEPEPRVVASASVGNQGNLDIQTNNRYREVDVWLREAFDAYQSGNDELALQRYNQVLEVLPRNRNALLARAAIHVQNANVDAAIEDYQTLLQANPKDSIAMSSLLGVASYSPAETETRLKLMLKEEPNSPYLNFALANAYSAQNRWQEAQSHYFQALTNNPEDPNYAYNLAVSLEHISQPRSAITYYQRALENYGNGLATFSREVVDQRVAVLGKL